MIELINKIKAGFKSIRRRMESDSRASLRLLIFGIFLLVPHIAFALPSLSDIGNAFVSALTWLPGIFFEAVTRILASVMGLVASLGGQFLDLTIRYAVNGENLRVSGILTGWAIFRDLVNILFIFILLYVAIMTILQVSSANTKRTIISVVLVGIFINFSFFLTAFVIDIGNSISTTLYNAATPGNTGVGGILVDRMDLAKLTEGVGSAESSFANGVGYLLNAVFFAIAGFVFFAGGFLFIFRHISLMFVLMLSPLALAAIILPQTQRHWKKWLNTLLESTFVAPAYLLMLVVTLTIASAQDLLSSGSQAGTTMGTSGLVSNAFFGQSGLFLNYIVIIGLMIGSLKVAKSISSSLAGSATRWAGKVAGGGGGYAYRRTVGRAARAAVDNEWLKDRANSSGLGGFAARQAMKVSNVGAKASGDFRSGALGSTLKSAGIDAGTASGAGGYNKMRENQVKRKVELGNLIGEKRLNRTEKMEKDRLERNKTQALEVGDSRTVGRIDLHLRANEAAAKRRAEVRKRREAERLEDAAHSSVSIGPNQEAADKLRKGETDLDKLIKGVKQKTGGGASGGGASGGGASSGGASSGGASSGSTT